MTRYALCPDDCGERFAIDEHDGMDALNATFQHLQGDPHNRTEEAAAELVPTVEVVEE